MIAVATNVLAVVFNTIFTILKKIMWGAVATAVLASLITAIVIFIGLAILS